MITCVISSQPRRSGLSSILPRTPCLLPCLARTCYEKKVTILSFPTAITQQPTPLFAYVLGCWFGDGPLYFLQSREIPSNLTSVSGVNECLYRYRSSNDVLNAVAAIVSIAEGRVRFSGSAEFIPLLSLSKPLASPSVFCRQRLCRPRPVRQSHATADAPTRRVLISWPLDL